MRMVARTLEIRGDTTMFRTRRFGTTPEGFAYDWEQIAVGQSAAGLTRRIELFPVQQAIAARARFEELAREVLTPHADNRLVRVLARKAWLSQVDPENPPETYASDAVLVDHRAGVNAGEVVGAAEVHESIAAGTEVFGALVIEPRAVRGDRLDMVHWAYVQEGGFEAPGLSVIELGDDDLVCRVTSFDETEAAIALAFMNARYRELTGHTATVEHDLFAGFDAINRGDWEAFEATLPPDLVAIDHRPLGFAPADRRSVRRRLDAGFRRAGVELRHHPRQGIRARIDRPGPHHVEWDHGRREPLRMGLGRWSPATTARAMPASSSSRSTNGPMP